MSGRDWEPPPQNVLKCNVDAAVFADGASYGAVVRDQSCNFVAARSGSVACNQDPLLAESLAAKEALTLLAGLVVKQCVSIARGIGDVKVLHVKRTANQVAHVLARVTDSSFVSKSWDIIPPDCIVGLLNV
ncbi:PREDICTED: uncharacterized protein LOC109147315 [Ipomoea nil]|uniref:uncharacterized protein LOC109147315 n=1 Tax=Ipomoea nil TaxID=35883 RepID=UPI000900982C|nr:PREDICTED: uncharacterized protein LOC109147315 [Ipomoea nil]